MGRTGEVASAGARDAPGGSAAVRAGACRWVVQLVGMC